MNENSMHSLVIGGTGVAGSAVVDLLSEQGISVISVSRRNITDKRKNVINIAKRCSFILKEKEPKLPKVFTTKNNVTYGSIIIYTCHGELLSDPR